MPDDVERTPPRELSHDEAGRARVEEAQAARELRVKRFNEGYDPNVSLGDALRELGHTIRTGDKPPIVRDMDVERRRQERLEDRPLERQWKLYRKHPRPQPIRALPRKHAYVRR